MAGKLLAHLRQQWIGAIALLLVLTGGTAYALDGSNTVFTDDIVNGEVKVADIGQGAVGTDEIANNQVKAADLGDGEVRSADIGAGQVGASELAANSVRADEIDDGQVKSPELGNGQVQAEDLAPGVAPGASGARAWGLVSSDGTLVRSKQVTSVTRVAGFAGVYCIDPAPGIDPDTAVMIVGGDSRANDLIDTVSENEWVSSANLCPAQTMQVITYFADGRPGVFGELDEGGFDLIREDEPFTFMIP